MSIKTRKLIAVVGPTASGKSGLAVRLAEKFNGEVISADSRQVYKDLTVGSGLISGKETKGVPHHLIGFVDPKETFTAAEFKKMARKEIQRIWEAGRLPIMVGGTGLYIRAALDGLTIPEVEPNPKLRSELGKKSIEELSRILKKMDRRRWEEIDKKNPRRLIRAIEIAKMLGKVPKPEPDPLKADILFIGVNTERKQLEAAVRRRVRNMIGNGLIKETQKLIDSGIGEQKIMEFGFEYADTLGFINNETGLKPELQKNIERDTLKYAKRQITWFKKDRRIHWVKNRSEALDLAEKFIYH